jgi:hypothetical protein
MNASRALVGSLGGAVLAVVAVGGGCSASPSPPESADATAADANGGGCYVDASLAVFAASDAAGADCAACVQTNCQPAITTCANDCTCIGFFTCVADAGTLSMGLSQATQAAVFACAGPSPGTLIQTPGLSALLQCLQGPCNSICSELVDAGVDAPVGASEAAPETGPGDAGADPDAATTDARVTDAGADGG